MIVNFSARTIELTSNEAIEASRYGSDAYKDLQAARRDNPDFKIVTKKAKRNSSLFAKIKLSDITRYVEAKGTVDQKDNLEKMLHPSCDIDGITINESVSYFEIKTWFFNQFPDIMAAAKSQREQLNNIIHAA